MERSSKKNLGLLALAPAALFTACVATYPASGPDDAYARPYYPPRGVDYGYSREQFARLAHELDDRAARAHALAERHAASYGPREQEFFERIHHFSDQSRDFHFRYENGDIRSRGELRDNLNHLLADARATDDAIRRANVFPEVWDEWQRVIRVLERMLDVARA